MASNSALTLILALVMVLVLALVPDLALAFLKKKEPHEISPSGSYALG